jgi:methyl-accepting chemotaxis protein
MNEVISIENLTGYFTEIINAVMQQIDKIILYSGDKFLEIGDNLQKDYKVTKEITDSASSAANFLSGSLMLGNITLLNEIMDKSGISINNSSREIASEKNALKEVLAVLNKAVESLSGFTRIVKHLRMLGISTKIESARINIEDSGFTTIAENVEKLSTIINDKSNDIREKAFYLIKTIDAAEAQILQLENSQNEQADLILKNIKSSFNSLVSRYNLYSEKAKTISSISAKISESISEIVSDIQIHDIMRQQLEHVKEGLNEVLGKMLLKTTNDDDLINILYAVYDIVELQCQQLNHSKNEFVNAADGIYRNLNVILNSLAELSEIIEQITGFDISNGSFISEIERGLGLTSSELIKNINVSSELASSMISVSDTVGNLNSYVHEIDEIGTEVEMIALNARVKAAHTGSEGAALGVLAESIQRLSADARSYTTQVSEILTLIMKTAEGMKVNSTLELKNTKSEEISVLNNSIEQLLKSLNEIDRNTVSIIISTKNSISQAKNSISTVIENFEIHNLVDSDISGICLKLEEITGSINRGYSNYGQKKSENIKSLKNNYTTSGERVIHQKLAQVKEKINRDSITKNHKNDNDLGDNVELF